MDNLRSITYPLATQRGLEGSASLRVLPMQKLSSRHGPSESLRSSVLQTFQHWTDETIRKFFLVLILALLHCT